MTSIEVLMDATLLLAAVMFYRRGEYGPALFLGSTVFFFILFAR
jgi:hypothetical protein